MERRSAASALRATWALGELRSALASGTGPAICNAPVSTAVCTTASAPAPAREARFFRLWVQCWLVVEVEVEVEEEDLGEGDGSLDAAAATRLGGH